MASYHRYKEMTLNKMMLFEDVLYTSDSKKLEELKSINTDFFVVSVYPCLKVWGGVMPRCATRPGDHCHGL